MAESSSSEADYQPCFQAVGQTAFAEENNFFYHNYDQQCLTTTPIELSILPPPQPPLTGYAYNYSNFHPPDVSSSTGYPSQCFPPQDSASVNPLPPKYPLNQSTRKRKIPKEKTMAPKKKKTTIKEKNNTLVKKEETDESTRMEEETGKEVGKDEGEQPLKKKKKKRAMPREGLAEWDFKHRKEFQSYPKGSILVKCEDVNSQNYGKEIWMVENYQLINKYVMERDDPVLGRIFVKTERYSGWMSDESWSYFLLNGTRLDAAGERIGMTLFPMEDTIRDFCVMEKLRNPFYDELMQRLKEQDQTTTVKTEVADKLEEGEIVSDTERPIKEEPHDEEEEDLEDLKEIDKTQLFFYNN